MAMLNNDTVVETTKQFSLGWIHQVSCSPSFQRPTFPGLLFGRANCPRQLRKVVLVASISHPFWGRWATHFSTHNPLSDSSHVETCGSTPHHPKLPGGFAESSLPGPMLRCWVLSYPKRIHGSYVGKSKDGWNHYIIRRLQRLYLQWISTATDFDSETY